MADETDLECATLVGLAPIGGPDARLLILGSFPGEASLAASRYYGHPRNQFWRLVGSVVGERLEGLDPDDRVERLVAHRVAVWDRNHQVSEAVLEIKYCRVCIYAPTAKQKYYGPLTLTVIQARERNKPQGRERVD